MKLVFDVSTNNISCSGWKRVTLALFVIDFLCVDLVSPIMLNVNISNIIFLGSDISTTNVGNM